MSTLSLQCAALPWTASTVVVHSGVGITCRAGSPHPLRRLLDLRQWGTAVSSVARRLTLLAVCLSLVQLCVCWIAFVLFSLRANGEPGFALPLVHLHNAPNGTGNSKWPQNTKQISDPPPPHMVLPEG